MTGMICNGSGACCSTALDDDLPREKGEVDTYGPGKLGECSNFEVGVGEFHLTVTTSDEDGWFIEWAKVKLAGGASFTCYYNGFIKNKNPVPPSRTAKCLKGEFHNWHKE